MQNRSFLSSAAIVVAYAYPYAQVAYLRWAPGNPAWPAGGVVLVTLAARWYASHASQDEPVETSL